MKLTQEQLKQIIREELKNVMSETKPQRKAPAKNKGTKDENHEKQLHKLIQEEIATMSNETSMEEGVGLSPSQQSDFSTDEKLQEIVYDLAETMTNAAQKWLAMASRGQTPEFKEKLEDMVEVMVHYLEKGMDPFREIDGERQAVAGGFAALDADDRKERQKLHRYESKNRTKARTKRKNRG